MKPKEIDFEEVYKNAFAEGFICGLESQGKLTRAEKLEAAKFAKQKLIEEQQKNKVEGK